jgi:pilus assembly protein CpaF
MIARIQESETPHRNIRLDVRSVLGMNPPETATERSERIFALKNRLLTRIQENEELRRMNLDVLEGARRKAALRMRTEEIVRFELDLAQEPLTTQEREQVIREVLDEALELGPLEDLLKDDTIEEIMVNGPDRIFVARFGRMEKTDRRFSSAR